MVTKTHVILLASPAFIRERFVRRESQDGGFVVTTNCARARRYERTAADRALQALQLESFCALHSACQREPALHGADAFHQMPISVQA